MTINNGKISTGVNSAPMTVDAIRRNVMAIDGTIGSPIVVPLAKTLIVPNATVNVAITVASLVSVFGLTINSGGSITFDNTKGRMAT